MPATPLPSSGDAPAPKTCDASGMIDIHRMFRRSFGEGPALVRAVATGDLAHAEVVAAHLSTTSLGLHAHHEGEDERLWDALEVRAPSCATHVERMKEQHAVMVVHLRELDDALPAWRTHPSAETAAAVLDALEGVNAALDVHLPDEEVNIVPVMETVITQREIDWASEHGRRSVPKGQMWNQLGEILAAQPDGGAVWMRTHLPPPVRLAWRWVGRAAYASHRAALEGR